jgi:hypothetical protein
MIMYYIVKAIGWLNPLIHIAGFLVATWAFRRCRKRGYLVVAAFFALAVFSLLAMPKINRVIAERRSPDISSQTQERMNQAMHEAMQRVLEEEGHPPIVAERRIDFPLGPILLVLGLWLIARKEKTTEPKVGQVSSESAPCASPDEPST